MEERSAPLEVPISNDLESKKCDVENGSHNASRQEDNLSMPICFLVKEQAKSHVAIQDLQKRVESIETIQDDVIDSLAEIRKFLCNESKTFSGLNLGQSSLNVSNHTPSVCIPKSESIKFTYSPIGGRETKFSSVKECSPVKSSVIEVPQKPFESKSKESALESDKQDSGLDSDHLSLNKHSIHWVKQESGDELLQLLDEISQRTEVLQKQLSVIDPNSYSEDVQPDVLMLCSNKPDRMQSLAQQDESAKAPANCINCSKKIPTSVASLYVESSTVKKHLCDESPERFEGKFLSAHVHKMQKRSANKIDSAMVSSILKETSVVDLQRQVLIYLVENAVLHTKLGELEHLLSSKTTESNKIENSLKDETRLLMMENRELRISLDEQKLESNSLRSKVMMLERVLQSISVENRELTWQLGESLGIQNLARKEPRKFSSSYTFGNPTSSKVTRRSSLPSQLTCQNEKSNVNCVKSKLLSNASSFLDVTVEEPEQQWVEVQTPCGAYENHAGPMQSSTPFTKLKDIKTGMGTPSSTHFQSVKKRFRSTEKDDLLLKKTEKDGPRDTYSETCVKNIQFNSELDNSTAKFPFNSILEKLKSNSDYRHSRRTSLMQNNEVTSLKPASVNNAKLTGSEGEDSATSTENLRQNSQIKNARKGKNIHQRIQDILDRIMAESEEAT